MGENVSAIEIKREKLRIELEKEKPNYLIVKRLEDSIRRHKQIAKCIRAQRIKNKKKNERRNN